MSPSWTNRLRIAISPDRISLLKLGRGLKPKFLNRLDEVVGSPEKNRTWHTAVEVLDELLSRPEWQEAEVEVVLSNRLVRYAAITFDAKLNTLPAQEAYARHVLTQTYGSVVGQWLLRIQPAKWDAPWLVGAIDRELLLKLRQICTAHQLKLKSVTPILVEALNQNSKDFKSDPAWFVIQEPGYSQIALLRDKRIQALNGVCHENLHELPVLLDRENLKCILDERCTQVYLHTSISGNVHELDQSDYTFSVLESDVAAERSAMALKHEQMDFQKNPGEQRQFAGWLLLFVGLGLIAEMGFSYAKLQQERAAIQFEVRNSNLRLDISPREPTSAEILDSNLKQGYEIIRRLSTPWEALFVGLESVSNKNVAILSIEPNVQAGLLRIEGEAKDYASVLTLVAQLRTTKPFSEVFLLHHDTKRDDPQHPVGFVLTLRWGNS